MSDTVTEQITDQQSTVVKDEPVVEKLDADTKPEGVKEEPAAVDSTEDKSAEYKPAENTPAEDTPDQDTPAKDTLAGDTLAGDTPAGDTPAEDTPAEDTPAEDTPAEDTPAEDTPAEDTPAEDTPAEDTPAEDTPVEDTPAGDTPAGDTPAEDMPAEGETAATSETAPETEPATEADPAAEVEPTAEPEPEPEEVIEIPSGDGEWVLVTGATGYLGSNIVKQLVESGEFRVRGTTRTLVDNDRLHALQELLAESQLDLEFVSADFSDADSWKTAVKGCEYVVHCAAVYPDVENSVNVEELYKDGTLAVLKACQESETVKRIVMTSSLSAVSSGHNVVKNSMNEDTWADIEKTVGAVERSKVIAERAAWDFMKDLPEDCKMELSVVNPGFCVGPPLMKSEGKSAELIKKLLTREYEQLPKLNYSVIDVRDAALSHIRAMMIKQSAGQRHLVCQSPIWLKDMANILSQEFSSKGWNVSTTQVPYIKLWIKSHLKSGQEMKKILPYVGKVYNYDTKKMKKILQVEPREVRESIVEMAQAMIDLGMVEKVERPEKKSRKFSLRRPKKAAAVEGEGEEKKDDEKNEEDTPAEVPAEPEVPKDEPADAAEAEPTLDATVEPAADTEVKPEIEKASSEAEGSVPSDEEKKEEVATSDPESSKKKEKKEKKEKKKGLFSFSFKKNKKPVVEKKTDEEDTPAVAIEETEPAEQKEEEQVAAETTQVSAESTQPAAEDKPAEDKPAKVTIELAAEPATKTPEIVVNEPTEPAKTEEPKTDESTSAETTATPANE